MKKRFEETTPVSKSAMNQTLPTPIYHKPSPSLSEINTANRYSLLLLVFYFLFFLLI